MATGSRCRYLGVGVGEEYGINTTAPSSVHTRVIHCICTAAVAELIAIMPQPKIASTQVFSLLHKINLGPFVLHLHYTNEQQ